MVSKAKTATTALRALATQSGRLDIPPLTESKVA